MGGRGASGPGALMGIVVDANGSRLEYRDFNGTVINSFDGNGSEIPLSLREIKSRALQNGYSVMEFNTKLMAKWDAAYKQGRDAANKMLDQAYVNENLFVKTSRATRVGNRAARRKG